MAIRIRAIKLGGLISLALLASVADACEGVAPVVSLRDRVRIEARAQSGLRILGKLVKPEVVSIRQGEVEPRIPLKVLIEVTEPKDVRPWWVRLFSDEAELQAVAVPNVIELRPERVLDADMSYDVQLREGSEIFVIQLYFVGGIQRGGCAGEPKLIPFSQLNRK